MALPSTYTQEYKRFGDLFEKIRDAQVPSKFTTQLLEDWGFKSKNHRAFIPVLKALGFLKDDGSPTQRYSEYRSHSASKSIMGDALKESYSDIFLIKEKPSATDKSLIEGKFKSYHNTSDIVAGLMSKTFFSLLELADLDNSNIDSTVKQKNDKKNPEDISQRHVSDTSKSNPQSGLGLHYNIQIHLPATKDVEVYNAIFKSLKDHLIG